MGSRESSTQAGPFTVKPIEKERRVKEESSGIQKERF